MFTEHLDKLGSSSLQRSQISEFKNSSKHLPKLASEHNNVFCRKTHNNAGFQACVRVAALEIACERTVH